MRLVQLHHGGGRDGHGPRGPFSSSYKTASWWFKWAHVSVVRAPSEGDIKADPLPPRGPTQLRAQRGATTVWGRQHSPRVAVRRGSGHLAGLVGSQSPPYLLGLHPEAAGSGDSLRHPELPPTPSQNARKGSPVHGKPNWSLRRKRSTSPARHWCTYTVASWPRLDGPGTGPGEMGGRTTGSAHTAQRPAGALSLCTHLALAPVPISRTGRRTAGRSSRSAPVFDSETARKLPKALAGLGDLRGGEGGRLRGKAHCKPPAHRLDRCVRPGWTAGRGTVSGGTPAFPTPAVQLRSRWSGLRTRAFLSAYWLCPDPRCCDGREASDSGDMVLSRPGGVLAPWREPPVPCRHGEVPVPAANRPHHDLDSGG